jgi:hypothetical protein
MDQILSQQENIDALREIALDRCGVTHIGDHKFSNSTKLVLDHNLINDWNCVP